MRDNFYYFFEMETDEDASKSFNIVVESIDGKTKDSIIKYQIINPNKVKPKIKCEENLYKIYFDEIYNGIDIRYDLSPSIIKEYITVKNRKATNKIGVKYELENCSLYDDGETIKVVDDSGYDIFIIEKPEIINSELNTGVNLGSYIKQELIGNSIFYHFDNSIIRHFPVLIDPTMRFYTRAAYNNSYLHDRISKNNILFITGTSNRDDFIENKLKVEDGKLKTFCDDIVFGNKFSFIFPYVVEGYISITFVGPNGKSSFVQSDGLELSELSPVINSGEGIISSVSYADIEFNNLEQKEFDIYVSLYTKVGQAYSDERIVYSRRIKNFQYLDILYGKSYYLPGTLENNIEILNLKSLRISHISSFKPLKYIVVPYKLSYSENQGKEIGETSVFDADITSVEQTQNDFKVYFDINSSDVPEKVPFLYDQSNIKLMHNYNKSYVNDMEIILKSAINNKTNVIDGYHFYNRYVYVSPSDFIVKKQGEITSALMNLVFQLVPSFYLEIKNGETILDISEIEVSEMELENVGENTKILLNGVSITEVFTGDISVDFESGTESVDYAEIDDNILKNGIIVLENNDKLFVYKIIQSTENSIYINKRASSIILGSNKLSIFLFDPKRVRIDSSSGSERNYKKPLSKSSLDSSGNLVYNVMTYEMTNAVDSITVYFYDDERDIEVSRNYLINEIVSV